MNKQIIIDNTEDVMELINGYDTEDFKVIEEGDWVSRGKYEVKECIIQDIETGKYYKIFADRTGSLITQIIIIITILRLWKLNR